MSENPKLMMSREIYDRFGSKSQTMMKRNGRNKIWQMI